MMETIRKKYTLGKAGFSFAELMIVMAMVAVLAAIATPIILRGLPEKRLRSATRNLYADLQKARLLAVKTNRQVTVKFHMKDQADPKDYYWFDTNDQPGDSDKKWDTDEFGKNLDEGIAYGSGSAGDGDGGGDCNFENPVDECTPANLLSFFYQGTATSGTVYLQNQNDDICYAVTVTSFGNVKIRRFNGKSWDEK